MTVTATVMMEAVDLFREAFAASLLVALVCSLLGVHVVARRLVVVGVALPQVGALGIAVSFLLGGVVSESSWLADHDTVALVCVLAAVALLACSGRWRGLGQDTLAGVLFVAAGGLTILLVMRTAQGMDEVRNLVEGNVLAIHGKELGRMLVTLAPAAAVMILGGRRMLQCTFDAEAAATSGVRVGLWELLLHVCLAVAVAAGVHATGTLFVFGFLVLPGAAGVLFARSPAGVFATAVVVGQIGAALGFVLSYAWDTPTGPMCTTVALALFLVIAAAAAVRDRVGAERPAAA